MEAGSTLHGPQHAFQEDQVLAWTTSFGVLPETHVCDSWPNISGSIVARASCPRRPLSHGIATDFV